MGSCDGGDYAVEQMLTWVAIATSLLMALFSLCLHLRAAIGQCIHPPKQREASGSDEQRTRDREHIRDIMSQIMDVETELQLQSIRKPVIEHQTEPLDIWSEWRLTVIAATVRIALVDILDLSEVDIPAGVFLHPAVGWG